MSVLAPLKHLIYAFFTLSCYAGCSEIYLIKNSQPIVRMAIGLRGLERKSPIIGSQASLQPANILFPLNRDP